MFTTVSGVRSPMSTYVKPAAANKQLKLSGTVSKHAFNASRLSAIGGGGGGVVMPDILTSPKMKNRATAMDFQPSSNNHLFTPNKKGYLDGLHLAANPPTFSAAKRK